jgi:hypothetical protein
LGKAARVQEVRVRWPDSARTQTSHRDLAVNRAYRISQGEAAVPLERQAVAFRKLAPRAAPPAHQHSVDTPRARPVGTVKPTPPR